MEKSHKILASLIPLGDCVLVDPEPPPPYQSYKKYAHLIVPEAYEHGPEDRAVWGVVIARGLACKGQYAVGNRIVFGKWAGARVYYEEHLCILVREDEILAVDDHS